MISTVFKCYSRLTSGLQTTLFYFEGVDDIPVFMRHDKEGSYYQYGSRGGKYYFTPGNEESKKRARQKAIDQMYAVEKSRERRGEGKPEKIEVVE